jgi:formamidase
VDIAAIRAERQRRSGHHMLAHRRVEAYTHATRPAYPVGAAEGGPVTIEGNEARTRQAKERLA